MSAGTSNEIDVGQPQGSKCGSMSSSISSASRTSKARFRNAVVKAPKSLVDIPHEVLLAIIAKVEYSPHHLNALYLTNHLLHSLMCTYRTGIISEIAEQQFPLESVLINCESASPSWLRNLRKQKQIVQDILATCSRPVHNVSLAFHLLSAEQFNRFASIGLYLSRQHLANWSCERLEDNFEVKLARLRGAIHALPTMFLLCLHLASSILAEAIIQKVDFIPHDLKTHASELRIATEFLICWSGYTAIWPMLADFSDYDEEDKGMVQETKAMAKEGIILLARVVILGHLQGGTEGLDLGLQAEVERRIGRKARADGEDGLLNSGGKRIVNELDLAVIQKLKKETLSDKTVAQMLVNLQ